MRVVDESLSEDIDVRTEVVTTPIAEPYSLYRKLFGISGKDSGSSRVNSSGKSGNGFKEWAANVIRSNFFIPDPKSSWIAPSVKFLKEYLRNHPVDLIVSTGPPHSMHLIAMGLTKHIPCNWIADFRDPWTGMFYFKHMKMLPYVRARHRKLERKVVSAADAVIVVTDSMKRDFDKITSPDKVHVITNGFDPDDFVRVESSVSDKFQLVHTGLMIRGGNPDNIWKALRKMADTIPGFAEDLVLRLVGETDEYILERIEELGLGRFLQNAGYVPHSEVVEEQASATVLLLPLRDEPESGAILTGKFFEYLASGRPILAVGPVNGDLGKALRECEAGEIFEFSDNDGVYDYLCRKYSEYKKGLLKDSRRSDSVNRFSRKQLTADLVDIMDLFD